MTILVTGANGATGQLLVAQLLNRGQNVRLIVRSADKLADVFRKNNNVSIIEAGILDLSQAELIQHVSGCDALVSCLGHNMSLKGIYGPPRRLVADSTLRLCSAIQVIKPKRTVKFVLMNTAGNSNRDLHERVSFAHRCVIGLLRLLLPPQVDNEKAADYLRVKVGQNDPAVEWSVVRPDNLIDESQVSDYEVYPSPIRSALFDAGITSRINVAHFMADLILDEATWRKWKGRMPVLCNTAPL